MNAYNIICKSIVEKCNDANELCIKINFQLILKVCILLSFIFVFEFLKLLLPFAFL